MGNLIANAMAKIVAEALKNIMTYKFITRVTMHTAKYLVLRTENDLDDGWWDSTNEALGSPVDPIKKK